MIERHQSAQFDAALDQLTSKVLVMGGLVEAQLGKAMAALASSDNALVDEVLRNETRVDALEVEIDALCTDIIARRQPMSRDLRFLMSSTKIVGNLERAGDEAERIAKRAKAIGEDSSANKINYAELKLAADLAADLLRSSIDAYSRMDAIGAARLIERDLQIDAEFRGFVRKLNTYMSEDPRTISVGLDFLALAKAIERIGDHATNIAEMVIYIERGTDVRHVPRDTVVKQVETKR